MKKIKIDGRLLGEGEPCFIIAEAGVNHNGSVKLAKRLIEAAVDAKADAVKFQTFKAENLLLKMAAKPEYQRKTSDSNMSQYEMLLNLELNEAQHRELYDYTQDNNIIFLSTPYDEESVELLERLGVSAFKLSSIEIVNHPFIEYVAKKNKPVIMSTGLSTMEEIREAVEVVEKAGGKHNLILLHCHFNYPTKYDDVNLKVMPLLGEKFNVLVGFSDHTTGIIAPVVAVSLGANVIEKHITIDKTLPGPDHSASLEPEEFKEMVSSIRTAEKIIGTSLERIPSKAELSNIISRKSIVAGKEIAKGDVLTQDVLCAKRPGTGIYPTYANISKIVGKKARCAIKKDTLIAWEMIE